MRVLVAGASGFVGKNLLCHVPRTWHVTALFRQNQCFESYLRSLGNERIHPLAVDLSDRGSVERKLATSHGFDLCIYLAGNGDPAVSVRDPHFDLMENVGSLLTLLGCVPIDRMVYFSSGAVYDGLRGDVSPKIRPSPRLPYGISKYASELYGIHFFENGKLGSICNVRFFGAFGPHENSRKIYGRLVRQFGIERNPRFTIRGDGNNLIDAMYIDDAVSAILALSGAEFSAITVDLASMSPMRVRDLVETAAAVFGLNPEIECVGEVPEYIQFRSSDTFMRDVLGFRLQVDLKEGLRRFLHAWDLHEQYQ